MATDSSLPLHHAAVASSVHRDRGGRACEQRIVRGREKEGERFKRKESKQAEMRRDNEGKGIEASGNEGVSERRQRRGEVSRISSEIQLR